MGKQHSHGYTIIEVMLFMAITGLLIAGILMNASRSLQDQQYRDGVESIRNKIAAQFAKVYSLTNDATATDGSTVDPCESLRAVGDGLVSMRLPRGTSDCFYVGRYVEILPGDNKSQLRITPVIALPNVENTRFYSDQMASSGTSISGNLGSDYRIAKYSGNASLVEEDQFDWGLAAVSPGGNVMRTIKLLIIRSPIDGTVHTYNMLANDPGTLDERALQSRVNPTYEATAQFCVADLAGGLDPPRRQAIIIHKAATNASDVETRLNKPEKDGGGPEC